MKPKLEPYLCYVAGLQSRSKAERNAIGIYTDDPELESHFVKLCLDKFKVEPNRIIVSEEEGMRHIFFYHSKLGSQLRKISDNCSRLFRLPTASSRSYVAGIFDAAGYLSGRNLCIKGLTTSETLMLEQLGIYTRGTCIMNITQFFALIRGSSIMLHHIRLPKTKD